MEKQYQSPENLIDVEKWESENPVLIPDEIVRLIERRKNEFKDPNLLKERWTELVESGREMMNGDSDRDLYYQLATLEEMRSQGDDGLEIRKADLRNKLRNCWCGSGKKYKNCHGT